MSGLTERESANMPTLAPNLPKPTAYVFRGFIPESATGEESQSWYPTHIVARMKASAGFVRSIDYNIAGLQTCFGVRPARTDLNEEPGTVNGIIQVARVPKDGLVEATYYTLVPRPLSDFEALSWLSLPANLRHIYVQVSDPCRFKRATLRQPLLQTYLDQQLARAKNIGGNDPEGKTPRFPGRKSNLFALNIKGKESGWVLVIEDHAGQFSCIPCNFHLDIFRFNVLFSNLFCQILQCQTVWYR